MLFIPPMPQIYHASDLSVLLILHTPLEKRTQVWFELQKEISFAHEFLMKMLPENGKIKKIYRGTYTTDV